MKSDFNNINLKFIINNKDFTYDIVVNKFKYLKIEEKFTFNKIENLKIYLALGLAILEAIYFVYILLVLDYFMKELTL